MGRKSRAKAQARANAAAIAAAATPRRRGPNKIVLAAALVVLAVIGVVAAVVLKEQSRRDAITKGGKAVPAQAEGMGKMYVANRQVPLKPKAPTVEIYEDFQCPSCKQLEQQIGPTLRRKAEAGEIKLGYNLMTIIDSNAGTDHSLRAASAAMCAGDVGQKEFQAFHDAVFSNQPAKEGQGWTDEQLLAFGKQAQITGKNADVFKQCVSLKKYATYIKSTQDAAGRAKVTNTPTVKINGKNQELTTIKSPVELEKVLAAASA